MRDSQTAVLKELGRRVRRARLVAELTQEEAAASAGIDYKHWQEIEAGRANPTMRTLVLVARAFRMRVWDLLGPDTPSDAPQRSRVRRSKA